MVTTIWAAQQVWPPGVTLTPLLVVPSSSHRCPLLCLVRLSALVSTSDFHCGFYAFCFSGVFQYILSMKVNMKI